MKLRYCITFFCLTLLMGSILAGCKKSELPAKPTPSPFSAVVKGNAAIPAAGGVASILITAGADGWWIVVPDSGKDWCTITKIYGSGDLEVPVTFKANSTGKERTVDVAVNPTFNLPPVHLVFTQAAN